MAFNNMTDVPTPTLSSTDPDISLITSSTMASASTTVVIKDPIDPASLVEGFASSSAADGQTATPIPFPTPTPNSGPAESQVPGLPQPATSPLPTASSVQNSAPSPTTSNLIETQTTAAGQPAPEVLTSSSAAAGTASSSPAPQAPSLPASSTQSSSNPSAQSQPSFPPTSFSTSSTSSVSQPEVATISSSGGMGSSAVGTWSSSSFSYSTTTTTLASSTSSSSPAPMTSQQTGPTGSSTGSSNNIAVIAAPVAIGAVVVPVLFLFFCWWKRRKSFRGQYHHRSRSHDTEMSNLGIDAPASSHEPKTVSEHSDMAATSIRERPSTMPGQTEPKTSLIESTFLPGVLPGLTSRSPIGTPSVSPPPYRMKDGRSDSPTIRLPEAIEPLDVTRSQNIAGPDSRPTNAYHQPIPSGRVRTSDEDLDWPLPSPFRDQSPKKEAPNTPPLVTIRKARPPSSKSESPRPLPSPPMSLGRGEALTGSSSPGPVLSRGARQASPSASERDMSRQSPFDDANANDSASEYSVSTQDKRPRSSMLNVPEEKHINDDGISEMSASSRGSNRRSRLNQRASDEISAVSSLSDNDNVCGQSEARTESRQSVIAALPHIVDT